MAHQPRRSLEERISLINECRRSGLTDADWCRHNHIPQSTFYTWLHRARNAGCDIPEPAYGHSLEARPQQDVVPIEIIGSHSQEPSVLASISMPESSHLENSHTIEVVLNGASIRISNDADPALLTRTLRILKEATC